MSRLDALTYDIRDLRSRLSALERINQSNVLTFGDITLDGNTGLITAGDITIDGSANTITVGANGDIIIDANNDRILMKDSAGVNRILLDAGNGVQKISEVGQNVLTATDAQLTFLSTYRPLRESIIHTSGGNTFTNLAPFQTIADFLTDIDFDDWDDMEWFFEASFKAGTGLASVRPYNQTDASTPGSVTTTSTSYVSVRSTSLTKPTGVKTFVVQFGHSPSGGGSDFINLTIARYIFRRPA